MQKLFQKIFLILHIAMQAHVRIHMHIAMHIAKSQLQPKNTNLMEQIFLLKTVWHAQFDRHTPTAN